MAQTTLEKKKYTYEDYIKTPEDKRYELLEGDLLMTPSPIPNHQRISRELLIRLSLFIKEHHLGEVFYAPCDVYLDDENVVQPDILFIAKDRLNIIGEKNIQGAPDLVIEIISEDSAYRDLVQKKKLYAKFGVKEYWIVIPDEAMVEVYNLKKNRFELLATYSKDAAIESSILKGLMIEIKEIF